MERHAFCLHAIKRYSCLRKIKCIYEEKKKKEKYSAFLSRKCFWRKRDRESLFIIYRCLLRDIRLIQCLFMTRSLGLPPRAIMCTWTSRSTREEGKKQSMHKWYRSLWRVDGWNNSTDMISFQQQRVINLDNTAVRCSFDFSSKLPHFALSEPSFTSFSAAQRSEKWQSKQTKSRASFITLRLLYIPCNVSSSVRALHSDLLSAWQVYGVPCTYVCSRMREQKVGSTSPLFPTEISRPSRARASPSNAKRMNEK